MKAKTKTKRNKPKLKLSIKIDTRLLFLLFLPLFSFMETGSGQWITKKSPDHDSYVPAHLATLHLVQSTNFHFSWLLLYLGKA